MITGWRRRLREHLRLRRHPLLWALLGLIALVYGRSAYQDEETTKYLPDDRYRFECPAIPKVFPYRAYRIEKVPMGPYRLVYPHLYAEGLDLPTTLEDGRVIDAFQVIMPDMWPAWAWTGPRWKIGINRLYIGVTYSPSGERPYGRRERHDKSKLQSPEPAPELGLLQYRGSGRGPGVVLSTKAIPLFTPLDPSYEAAPGHPLELECTSTKAPGGPRGMCDVVFPIRPHLWVRYRFFKNYLPCWRTIHEAVVRLINGWIVEEASQ